MNQNFNNWYSIQKQTDKSRATKSLSSLSYEEELEYSNEIELLTNEFVSEAKVYTSITNISIEDRRLIITFANGLVFDCGTVKGEKIILRKTTLGIEYKYENESDEQYKILVPIDDILYKFENLTNEQKEELKFHFSDFTDDEIKLLQQPALDVVVIANDVIKEAKTQIKNIIDLSTNINLLNDRISEEEDTRENNEAIRQTNEEDREKRTNSAIDEINSAKDLANSATEKANTATDNANASTENAKTATENAKTATDRANTAVEKANAATDKAKTATENANTAANNANTATENANTSTEKANTATEKANVATENANTAADKANTAADNINTATENANNATEKANTSAQNADEKAKEAKTQADYAKEQGDYAQKQSGKLGLYDKRLTDLELNKVDGAYSEEGLLQLTSQGLPVGDPIEVGTGSGGGGSAGVTCKVKTITETLLSTVSGASVQIGYSFTSIYADDGSETGNGTATYTINSQKVATEAIQQGNVYFNVTKWLQVGSNAIKITVKDSTGQSRSVAYTVEVINMYISDSYDDTQINSGEITYRYTPVGAIAKTVHFILDGTEIGKEETSVSNRQLSFVIPAKSHGAHRLVVYMTATIGGVEVRSNELAHDLICVVEGNKTAIVASSFNQTTAQQYDRLSIPFVIYNPAASTSSVTLFVNGVNFSEQTVDRTLQTWNYRITQPGELVLKIASGNVSKTFNLNVTEAGVIVEPETADLALFLTAANRSNNDNNKDEWKYGNITTALTNFNFKTNGWINENGSTVLRVSGDARVAIPYHIFANDFRASGKTIEFEFETRDVIDYDAVVIDCLVGGIGLQVTAQEALFKSEQTTVSTRFKEEERVRVSFVIEKKTDNRLIYIYINGILSGVAQYPNDDNFQQATPTDIVIGSNDCTVDLYNIRI